MLSTPSSYRDSVCSSEGQPNQEVSQASFEMQIMPSLQNSSDVLCRKEFINVCVRIPLGDISAATLLPHGWNLFCIYILKKRKYRVLFLHIFSLPSLVGAVGGRKRQEEMVVLFRRYISQCSKHWVQGDMSPFSLCCHFLPSFCAESEKIGGAAHIQDSSLHIEPAHKQQHSFETQYSNCERVNNGETRPQPVFKTLASVMPEQGGEKKENLIFLSSPRISSLLLPSESRVPCHLPILIIIMNKHPTRQNTVPWNVKCN